MEHVGSVGRVARGEVVDDKIATGGPGCGRFRLRGGYGFLFDVEVVLDPLQSIPWSIWIDQSMKKTA